MLLFQTHSDHPISCCPVWHLEAWTSTEIRMNLYPWDYAADTLVWILSWASLENPHDSWIHYFEICQHAIVRSPFSEVQFLRREWFGQLSRFMQSLKRTWAGKSVFFDLVASLVCNGCYSSPIMCSLHIVSSQEVPHASQSPTNGWPLSLWFETMVHMCANMGNLVRFQAALTIVKTDRQSNFAPQRFP